VTHLDSAIQEAERYNADEHARSDEHNHKHGTDDADKAVGEALHSIP
jgi:hypothetical protein